MGSRSPDKSARLADWIHCQRTPHDHDRNLLLAVLERAVLDLGMVDRVHRIHPPLSKKKLKKAFHQDLDAEDAELILSAWDWLSSSACHHYCDLIGLDYHGLQRAIREFGLASDSQVKAA